jgi:hypothetical protein
MEEARTLGQSNYTYIILVFSAVMCLVVIAVGAKTW